MTPQRRPFPRAAMAPPRGDPRKAATRLARASGFLKLTLAPLVLPLLIACADQNGPTDNGVGSGSALYGTWKAWTFVIDEVDLIEEGYRIAFTFDRYGNYTISVDSDQDGWFCSVGTNCIINGSYTHTRDTVTLDPDEPGSAACQYFIAGSTMTIVGEFRGHALTAILRTFGKITEIPAEIIVVSGDEQAGTAGEQLREPLVVEVRNSAGDSMPDIEVLFEVVLGEGAYLSDDTVTTDGAGRASTLWTLATRQVSQLVKVTTIRGTAKEVYFTATAVPWGLKFATSAMDAHNFINGFERYPKSHAVEEIAATDQGFFVFYRGDREGSADWGWKRAPTPEDALNFLNRVEPYSGLPKAEARLAYQSEGALFVFYSGTSAEASWGWKRSTDIDDMYAFLNGSPPYDQPREGTIGGLTLQEMLMFYRDDLAVSDRWAWKAAWTTDDAYNFLNGLGGYTHPIEKAKVFATDRDIFYIFYSSGN